MFGPATKSVTMDDFPVVRQFGAEDRRPARSLGNVVAR
jgi:hypothetical protein